MMGISAPCGDCCFCGGRLMVVLLDGALFVDGFWASVWSEVVVASRVMSRVGLIMVVVSCCL